MPALSRRATAAGTACTPAVRAVSPWRPRPGAIARIQIDIGRQALVQPLRQKVLRKPSVMLPTPTHAPSASNNAIKARLKAGSCWRLSAMNQAPSGPRSRRAAQASAFVHPAARAAARPRPAGWLARIANAPARLSPQAAHPIGEQGQQAAPPWPGAVARPPAPRARPAAAPRPAKAGAPPEPGCPRPPPARPARSCRYRPATTTPAGSGVQRLPRRTSRAGWPPGRPAARRPADNRWRRRPGRRPVRTHQLQGPAPPPAPDRPYAPRPRKVRSKARR